MKKGNTVYLVFWVLSVALFNFICFIIPSNVNGYNKYGGAFWPCYAIIMISFIIHAVYILKVPTDKRETPVVYISYFGLLLMFIASGICMAIPAVSYWVGAIICAVILVFSIVFIMTSHVVGERAIQGNQRLNSKVALMRGIQDDAKLLGSKAKTKETKNLAKKIDDAVRFSDTTSNPSLESEELEIKYQINKVGVLMENNADIDEISKLTEEICLMIDERNLKCKSLKRQQVIN